MARVAASPCDARTQRCADARDYDSELAECCRQHVIKVVTCAAEFLTDMKAGWWGDYGTLLGGVRNAQTTWADYPWLSQSGRTTPGPAPGIIPHDKDADLGVEFKAWEYANRKLRSFAEARGLHLYKNVGRHSMKVRLSFRNNTNVDLFFWRERANGILYRDRYAQVDRFKGKEFHRSLLYPLTTVEWEGMTLPAPRDPEAFLLMRYGPKWRTPLMANNDGVKR